MVLGFPILMYFRYHNLLKLMCFLQSISTIFTMKNNFLTSCSWSKNFLENGSTLKGKNLVPKSQSLLK